MDEMFDMTFPPVRYRFPRYLASQGQGKQAEQERQQWARSRDDSKMQIARLDVSHYKPEEVKVPYFIQNTLSPARSKMARFLSVESTTLRMSMGMMQQSSIESTVCRKALTRSRSN